MVKTIFSQKVSTILNMYSNKSKITKNVTGESIQHISNLHIPIIKNDIISRFSNNSIIFVTAFKDINRDSWSDEFKRDVNTYIEYASNLFNMHIRIVCYCSKDISDRFKINNKHIEFRDYDENNTFYKYLSIETDIINSNHFKKLIYTRNDPECHYAEYNIVNHNKIIFVERTKKLYPNYSHYAWVDFGYFRNRETIPRFLTFTELLDTVEFVSLSDINISNIDIPTNICVDPSKNSISGGLFILPSRLVEWYLQEYTNMLIYYHSLNIVDDDQAIVLQLYKKFPDNFTIRINNKWFQFLDKYTSNSLIDVVIPLHIKDISTLNRCITGIKNHIIPLGNIYIVCDKEAKDKIQDGIFIDEQLFPFTKQDIGEYVFGDRNFTGHRWDRGVGWHYQQLLKLYAHRVINGISNNHLIVDSETIFYNDYIPFKDSIVNYTASSEIDNEYRNHISLLLPDIKFKYHNISGICHQMLFQTHILNLLFDKVEEEFLLKHGVRLPFWGIVAYFGKLYQYSEYEIYFNFIINYYYNYIRIDKNIRWDVSSIIPEVSEYTYLTCHSHLRNKEFPKDLFIPDLNNI